MNLPPANEAELAALLAHTRAERGRLSSIRLERFDRLVDHVPEDMTATVQCGMPWGRFQDLLRAHGQHVPLDPPESRGLTVGDVLNQDLTGPRRLAWGKARDSVLGLRAMQADGSIIQAGGKVVKNVAGFDLCRLLVGAGSSLAILLEATFKLVPVPASEGFLSCRVDLGPPLNDLLNRVRTARISPTVLDAHPAGEGRVAVVVGFSGSDEDVRWQTERAQAIGFLKEGSLAHEQEFWRRHQRNRIRSFSVLPSRLTPALVSLNAADWVCRAGNGLVHVTPETAAPAPKPHTALELRLKHQFDPDNLLPPLPARL